MSYLIHISTDLITIQTHLLDHTFNFLIDRFESFYNNEFVESSEFLQNIYSDMIINSRINNTIINTQNNELTSHNILLQKLC